MIARTARGALAVAPSLPLELSLALPAALSLAVAVAASCAAAGGAEVERPPADPAAGEVVLEAAEGWTARVLYDAGETGIWAVEALDVFPQYAGPEVVGLDDRGRCLVLVSYGGRWTPFERVHDGAWLGGIASADVDPRIDGAELYVGSELGNVYQLVAYHHGALDARLIAHVARREIHALCAGELLPASPGRELLAFTSPGGLDLLSPTANHGRFELRHLEELPSRVRDAVVLPRDADAAGDAPVEIATASRHGAISLLSIVEGAPRWREIHREPVGAGRVALRPAGDGPLVLYATFEDGRVLRLERWSAEEWSVEPIYAGPAGPRGVTAGRFDRDPERETVAVFGYSSRVQLLARGEDGWTAETIFTDRDRGHQLATAELDGRNGTREILGCGYGGRIFLLAREPGYGLDGGVPTDPDRARFGRPAPRR